MPYLLNLIEKTVDAYFAHRPRPKPKSIDIEKVRLVAHRGAHERGILENTLQAFEHALTLNCYGIELDVHASADGILVVHHDETLKRLFGHDVAIKKLRFDELRALVPEIPSLAEVVKAYGKKLHLYIELKTPFHTTSALIETLSTLRPVIDYHLLSLDETLFPRLNHFPRAALLLVPVHNNVAYFCAQSLKQHYGGILGHYLLVTKTQIEALLTADQLIGVGFIDSKYSLYHELNRGLRLIFTNQASTMKGLIESITYP